MKFRISVDTGGTFTDVVVADEHGKLMVGKALTTPDRVFTGFSGALQNAAASLNTSIEEILQKTGVLIYGTTRSTNAIVTSSAAKQFCLLRRAFQILSPTVMVENVSH